MNFKRVNLRHILLVVVAFIFSNCDNEPLEGDFITDAGSETVGINPGQFIATIDGVLFTADVASATFDTANNLLSIEGLRSNGETVTLIIANPSEGNLNLNFVGPNSSHGQYLTGNENPLISQPFISIPVNGGGGQLSISNFDTTGQTVTGTFNFSGSRFTIDVNGTPVVETVEITNGAFNTIPFVEGDLDPNTDPDPDPDPDTDPDGNQTASTDQFFALLDGLEFQEEMLVSEEISIGQEPVVRITATNSVGASIQIFVPRRLGTGTFEMESVLNGPVLLATYNDGAGGQTLNSNPGTITITEFGEVTGRLTGTFSFTGTDPVDSSNPETVSVTQGSFSVDYIDEPPVTNTITATIDAIPYTPETIDIAEAPVSGVTVVTITTQNATTNESLTLSFPANITPGTYTMEVSNPTGNEVIGLYNPDVGNSIVYASNPGTLVITGFDTFSNVIEGTFNFTGVDPAGNDLTTFEVTDGVFLLDLD